MLDGSKIIGYLNAMAKFIPIGTQDSFYDVNSKLKRIPKSLQNEVKLKKTTQVKEEDEENLTNIRSKERKINQNKKLMAGDKVSRKVLEIEVKSYYFTLFFIL